MSSRAPEHGHVRLNTRTVVHMCVSVRTRAHECASLYVHMHLNTVLREEIIEKDVDRTLYGWLPKMATSSKGSIGCVLASSFCERINSCANAVVTEGPGNTLLSDDEMELLVMLRMNKGCMECM